MHEAEKALFEAMKLYTHLGDGYYRDRVQRGSALENYEKAIFQYAIENWNPHATRVIEAGAGWGQKCGSFSRCKYPLHDRTGYSDT
jgi:hypothetical protein